MSKFLYFLCVTTQLLLNLVIVSGYKCKFETSVIIRGQYICNTLPDLDVSIESHLPDKSDDDVNNAVFNGTLHSMTHFSTSEFKFYERFLNLKGIYVYNVASIEEKCFQKYENLDDIWIVETDLEELPEKIFSYNTKLTSLIITENKFTTLPENLFVNNQGVSYLRLDKNQLSNLPANIFKPLVNLEMLFLEENQLETLHPLLFNSLGKLTSLNLYGNKISDLPKNIFTPLENIKQLYLGENQLTTIHSDSFGNIKRFTDIRFNDNKIFAIDEKLIDNTELNMIDLTKNVCSQEYITDRDKLKEKLRKCFENYKSRK